MTGAARNLLKVLGEKLTSSEREREAEAAAFNRKLYAADARYRVCGCCALINSRGAPSTVWKLSSRIAIGMWRRSCEMSVSPS